VLDGSYVGTVGHKLTTWSDVNPRQLSGDRIHAGFGIRHIRTSEGNSSYHAMQWRVERRFAHGFLANASYTWSKYLDSTSEGIGALVNQSHQRNLTSMPVAQDGLKLDHGPSDYDRTHRLAILYMSEARLTATGSKSLAGGPSVVSSPFSPALPTLFRMAATVITMDLLMTGPTSATHGLQSTAVLL
jgi:hypothetical protein